MYLCKMTGAEKNIHKHIVLQYSNLSNSKVSTGFLRQDLQILSNLGDIQTVGGLKHLKKKNFVFQWRKICYFSFTYMYICTYIYIYMFI